MRSAATNDEGRRYRRRMRTFPESALEDRDESLGLLSLVGITLLLLTAGIGLALLIAAAS
jgi:hypothetical protein